MLLYYVIAMDNYTVCGGGGVECMSDRGNYSTLLKEDLVTVDYQVIPKGNQEGEIIQSLRESGFLITREDESSIVTLAASCTIPPEN